MTVERIVRIVAGFMIVLSLALGMQGSPIYVSHYWLWLTAFSGLNLFQSGFTGFCPLDLILRRAGVQPGGL